MVEEVAPGAASGVDPKAVAATVGSLVVLVWLAASAVADVAVAAAVAVEGTLRAERGTVQVESS